MLLIFMIELWAAGSTVKKNKMLLIILSCLMLYQSVGATKGEITGVEEVVLMAAGFMGLYYVVGYGLVYGIKMCCAVYNQGVAPVPALINEMLLHPIEEGGGTQVQMFGDEPSLQETGSEDEQGVLALVGESLQESGSGAGQALSLAEVVVGLFGQNLPGAVAPGNESAGLVADVASEALLQDLSVKRDIRAADAAVLLDDVSDASHVSNNTIVIFTDGTGTDEDYGNGDVSLCKGVFLQ